jgi:hypothetical protein
VQYSDRETIASSELQAVLSGVTSKPQKQIYYTTYNSGYLEYQFLPGTVIAEIQLKFRINEEVYYGSTGILVDAIQASSWIGGVETNKTTMDIKQNGPTNLINYYGSLGTINLLSNTGTATTSNVYLYRRSVTSM